MKTVIYIGDYTQDFRSVPRDRYLIVQQYSYSCMRSRNDAGFPYGPVLTTIMDFTIRLQLPEDSKVFHQRMHDNNPYSYSFICDPEFILTGKKNLKDFVSAMIVVGHIIDVEETLDAKPNEDGSSNQIEVHIKLLISEITYVGKNQWKKLVLKQDSDSDSGDDSGQDDKKGGDPEIEDGEDGEDKGTPPPKKDDPVVAFSKYALYIGKSAPLEGIEGGITHSVSQALKSSDGKSVNVLLKSLHYHKKIFQPNEITCVLSLTWTSNTPPSHQTLTEVFMYKKAEMKVKNVATKLDSIIAKNFFVYQMNPCYKKTSSGSSMDLELHMFSLDKLMTLDKYCKAHTAKKLGAGIFTPELANFTVNGMAIEGLTDDMQFLKLADGEMRIPYAVQYDESFYDFMKRIAMRYGEYLFFEGGKLHLGLNPSEDHYWEDPQKKDKAKDWATSPDLVMRYYESMLTNAVTVEDHYFNYVSRNTKDTAIYSPASVTENNVTTNRFYNPDPVPADEWLGTIEKDGYSSIGMQYKYFEKFIMADFFKILESKSLAGILSGIIITEGMRAAKALVKVENLNHKYNEANIEPYKGDEYSDQKNGNKLNQFTIFNDNTALSTKVGESIVTFTSKYYSIIRAKERRVAEGAVYLEFGEQTQPFSLGDKVKIDGTDYIIVEIEGRAEKEEEIYKDTQKVMAVPLYDNVVIPPALPSIPLIREAKPQRAYIAVKKYDPEKIGRVRIRYPWQDKSEMSSPWIRVAIPGVTNGGGINFRPEDGDEAMIDYENGNIDKPFVAGYMPSPYIQEDWGASVLPERGMISRNGHSVTFSDGLDGMNFFWGWLPVMGTLKGFIPNATWPEWLKEKKDKDIVDLVGSTTITDRYGFYKISASSDGRKIDISSPMGDVSISAFTGIKINAPNGDISISGKNVSIKAANKLSFSSGSNLKDKYVDSDFAKDFGLGLLEGVSKVVEKAIDLSFLRTVMEIFTRPIDGTLKIKSSTFVMVEAGPGKVEVPRGVYAKEPKDYLTDDQLEQKSNLYKKITRTIAEVNIATDTLINNYVTTFNNYTTALTRFKTVMHNEGDHNFTIISFDRIKELAIARQNDNSDLLSVTVEDLNANADLVKDPPPIPEEAPVPKRDDFGAGLLGDLDYQVAKQQWEQNHANRPNLEQQRQQQILERTEKKNRVKDSATSLIRAMNELRKAAVRWRGYEVPVAQGVNRADIMLVDVLNHLAQQVDFVNDTIQLNKAQNLQLSGDVFVFEQQLAEDEKKIIRRKMVYKMLTLQVMQDVFKVKDGLTEPTYTDDKAWSKFVGKIYVDKSLKSKVKEWAYDHYAKNAVEFWNSLPFVGQHEMWGPKVKGQILFSDNPTKTVAFARNGMHEQNNVESISTRFEAEIKRILGDIK